MDDNVKPFPGSPDLPENNLQIDPGRRDGWCRHDAVVLDEHTRTVRCASPTCGATLDPFGYLLTNACSIQRAWSRYGEVMRQADEIAKRVTVLKKEEQRLRAMIKRLQEKTGAVVTVRGLGP